MMTDRRRFIAPFVTSIALRAGSFVEDVMMQYAQPRPWILLHEGEGNTYISTSWADPRARARQTATIIFLIFMSIQGEYRQFLT